MLLLTLTVSVYAAQTIIFIRHAEKPLEGLGQLSCKGLNRSMHLPKVIIQKFGAPDYLFAPNPTVQKQDKGVVYNYLRPLATIEPLAIRLGKNIDLSCGYNDIDCISGKLLEPQYDNKVLLVAWEHHNIANIIQTILSEKKISMPIDNWENDDFDTIYVLQIENNAIGFHIDHETLNHQNETCDF